MNGWKTESDETLENLNIIVTDIDTANDELYVFDENEAYSKAEIEKWHIERSDKEEDWTIEGKDLYEALENMKEDSEGLAEAIKTKDKHEIKTEIEPAKKSLKAFRQLMRNY